MNLLNRLFRRITILLLVHHCSSGYNLPPENRLRSATLNRRSYLIKSIVNSGLVVGFNFYIPARVEAATQADDPIGAIRDAKNTLQTLLDNWARAIIDCTYADVPRELLEAKNKEKLLEKASTFALFDKSVSVVSCKTSNRIVRDYLGRSGKGPLVGLDKVVKKSLSFVEDSDDLDAFVQASEALQQALSKADSLSYAAGIADFSAINNFDKADEQMILASNSNLEQARIAIQDAVDNLNRILSILSA